jgi:hypothetical protein
MFERGEKVAKNIYSKGKKKRSEFFGKEDIDSPYARLLAEMSKGFRLEEEEENEEYYDVIYEYIDLVYPPNTNPPTRNSFKRMGLYNLKQIHNMIY